MPTKKINKGSQTAGENVYSFLRKSIIELHVKPGQAINLKDLSDFLKVSRSPIRDALIQLEKDGLVTTAPQKGTFVSKIDIQRVSDERFLRACIEERIVEEFLTIYTERDIDRMQKIIDEQKTAAAAGDARAFLRLDDKMHAVFFEATNHPFCLNAVMNMSSHYYRIRLLSLSEPDIQEQTLNQHREIMDLVLKKDAEKLKKLLDIHIIEKGAEVNKLKAKHPEIFTGVVTPPPAKRGIWETDFLKSR